MKRNKPSFKVRASRADSPELSIVATVYNDAGIVPEFVKQVQTQAEGITPHYEIILVNDGSQDGSAERIENECSKNPRVKGVFLSRNFGQQIAMSAGIGHAGGERIIIMDGDLQNPPEAIPTIDRELQQGHDLVYCTSFEREHWMDELSSRLFWYVLINILGIRIIPNQLMMKGLSRRVVQEFRRYGEKSRVVAGIVHDIGLRSTVVKVQNRKRLMGSSHYSLMSRINLMIDIFLQMSQRPLNTFLYVGLFGFALAVSLGAFHVYRFWFSNTQPGYTSIILCILLFGCGQLVVLSLMGRYLFNIYQEVRNRPLYHVEKTVNLYEQTTTQRTASNL